MFIKFRIINQAVMDIHSKSWLNHWIHTDIVKDSLLQIIWLRVRDVVRQQDDRKNQS